MNNNNFFKFKNTNYNTIFRLAENLYCVNDEFKGTRTSALKFINKNYSDDWEERYLMLDALNSVDKTKLDMTQFKWDMFSSVIAEHAPHLFNEHKFNWHRDSISIVMYCPQYFDPEMFNWQYYSWALVKYCPELFDAKKYNWKHHRWAVIKYYPAMLK